MTRQTIQFVEQHEDCFERSLAEGHITGSAWVVNPQRTHALLVHHARLNKWLQPGGHADGQHDVLQVALREVEEETGIQPVPVSNAIFDVDVHRIPARAAEPEHLHYDIRYLMEARNSQQPVASHESHAVSWVRLDRIAQMQSDESVLRLVAKSRRS